MSNIVRKSDDSLELADLPDVLPIHLHLPRILDSSSSEEDYPGQFQDKHDHRRHSVRRSATASHNPYNQMTPQHSHQQSSVYLQRMNDGSIDVIDDDDINSTAFQRGDDFSTTTQSSTVTESEHDEDHSTTTQPPVTKGLHADGSPKLFSRWYFAIIIQYVAVGVYYSCMSGLGYSIFSNLLGLKSFQVKGSIQFVNIWWSFKTFFACISDCFPIMGYRRKWYVLVGWILAGMCTFWAICLGQPKPTDSPLIYIIAFSLFTLFYLIADCAMDGFIIDFAMHEPIAKRGALQSTIYLTRYIAMTASGLVIALGFNSTEYGGTWQHGLKLPQYLWILLIVNIIGWPFYYWLQDTPGHTRKSYVGHFVQIFHRLELTVVGKIVLFSFFVHILAYVSNAASYDIQSQFCHVTPLVDALGGQFCAYIAMALAIFLTKRFLLNVSWHRTLTFCILTMAILTYIPAVLVDFNIIRSPYFYVFAPLLTTFVSGVFFIVCALCATEVAEKGYEGITFGLLTTINNITNPMSVLFSANLASFFSIYGADGRTLLDTTDSRWELFKLDTTIFFIQLCSLFSLLLLPRQKIELQIELQQGKRSRIMAILISIAIVFCFIWSLLGNFAQASPLSCLVIVGGSGCH